MEKSLWSNVMENLVFVLVALAVAVGFVLIAYLVEKYLKTQEKKPSRRPRKSPKDVRLFVNTFDKAVASMKNAGIEAIAEKSETNEYIICTVKIPKAV